jgi:hypothetical protein
MYLKVRFLPSTQYFRTRRVRPNDGRVWVDQDRVHVSNRRRIGGDLNGDQEHIELIVQRPGVV